MSLSKFAPANKMFDWLFVFFAGWSTVGIYIDGWAHIHLEHELESFFTPWHALFYAGVLMTGICLILFLLYNKSKGYTFRYALPKEYMFSLVGIGLMVLGGIGDMCWHEVFGIEVGMDALFSPTHLLLAIGGVMAVSGPLYGVWYRHGLRPIHDLPTILSTLYFMSILTFMLQFVQPFSYPWAAASFAILNPIPIDYGIMLGMASLLIFTTVFVGIIMSTVKHWVYPFGSFTIVLSLNAALMTFMNGEYYRFIWTGLIAGFLIDILYWLLINRRRHKMYAVHMFGFGASFLFALVFMMTILLTDTMVWSLHTWTGAIFIAGIAGYLLSYFVLPTEKY